MHNQIQNFQNYASKINERHSEMLAKKSLDDFTHFEWDQSSFIMFVVPICILNHFDGENLGSVH